ncbi:MAG: transglycosylase family protein [Actinomycetota bacterium]
MIVVACIALTTVPVGAAPAVAEADVDALALRADAWTAARAAHVEAARQQALQLADDARQAEADRIAADEAAREAELARQRAAEEAARTTTTTTTVPPTTTSTAAPPTTGPPADPPVEPPATTTTAAPAPGTPTAAQWEALRQCESSGNYSIVNPDGRYRGAYQFSQATWDWVASTANPALVGVDPAAAAPADQDAMALALWLRQGWKPWPHCGQIAAAA